MPNHVHLIAVPETLDGLARAIGEAHRRYTRHINFREGWRGYLWQGRFASYVMDEEHFLAALKEAPDDYAGLLMMATCYLSMNRKADARRTIDRAKQVYPDEPLAEHMSGMAELASGNFSAALADFQQYERLLPGNANTTFYKGRCLESMGRRSAAAIEYRKYHQTVGAGEFAGYVNQRLAEWGYLAPTR